MPNGNHPVTNQRLSANFLQILISYISNAQKRLQSTQKKIRESFIALINALKANSQPTQAQITHFREDCKMIRDLVEKQTKPLEKSWDQEIEPIISLLLNRIAPNLDLREDPNNETPRIDIAVQELMAACNGLMDVLPKTHLIFVQEEFKSCFSGTTLALQAFMKTCASSTFTTHQLQKSAIAFRDAYEKLYTKFLQIDPDTTWKPAGTSQTMGYSGLLLPLHYTEVPNNHPQHPNSLKSGVHFKHIRSEKPRLLHGLSSLTSTSARISEINIPCTCAQTSPTPNTCSCRSLNLWTRILAIELKGFESVIGFDKHLSSYKYRSYLTSGGVSWLALPGSLSCLMGEELLVDDDTTETISGDHRQWVQLQRKVQFEKKSTLQNPTIRVWFTGFEFRLGCTTLPKEPFPLEMQIFASNITPQGFDVTVKYPHSWTEEKRAEPVFKLATVGVAWFAHESSDPTSTVKVISGSTPPLKEFPGVEDIIDAGSSAVYTTSSIKVPGYKHFSKAPNVFVGLSGFIYDWQSSKSTERKPVGVCDVILDHDKGVVAVAGSGTKEGELNFRYDWVAVE